MTVHSDTLSILSPFLSAPFAKGRRALMQTGEKWGMSRMHLCVLDSDNARWDKKKTRKIKERRHGVEMSREKMGEIEFVCRNNISLMCQKSPQLSHIRGRIFFVLHRTTLSWLTQVFLSFLDLLSFADFFFVPLYTLFIFSCSPLSFFFLPWCHLFHSTLIDSLIVCIDFYSWNVFFCGPRDSWLLNFFMELISTTTFFILFNDSISNF